MGKKRGPDPLPPADRRTYPVSVYLSPAELAELCSRAIPGGTDDIPELGVRRRLAAYLRNAALGSLPPQIPAINREAWANLSRVAANLNQYQATINAGTTGAYPPEVLAELANQVQELRADLLGVRGTE